ncbi:M24 family metallopeptidase [Microbacterium sp. YY-01]|uniref:M24 family metallopeptidase n=1 Tax=Microbacterium sp. YY-01 TaxID=3421634 RepID=UPI003D176CE3
MSNVAMQAPQERWERIAREVERSALNAVIVTTPGSIAFATGIDPRTFIDRRAAVAVTSDSAVVIAADCDLPAIQTSGFTGTVVTWPRYEGAAGRARALTSLGLDATTPTQHGIGAADAEATAVVARAQRTKSDDDVAALRTAANVTDVAYTATVDRLHPELRAYEIVRNVDRSIRAMGDGAAWSLDEADAALGATTVFPREAIVGLLDRVPESGVLDRMHPLPFQLHPLEAGWMGASGTTVVFREPDARLRSTAASAAEGLRRAIEALSPGTTGAEIHATFTQHVGGVEGAYLVGFESGMGPGPLAVGPACSRPLEDREVLVLRAGAPGAHGAPGVFFQTTVLITPQGSERLDTVIPLRLIELY